MEIVIVGFILLSVMAIVYGWIGSKEIDVILELKMFNNPFYNIGVSFNQKLPDNEGEYVENEFIIGLFFVNIVVVFFKENEA
jgi:hypothetical protein